MKLLKRILVTLFILLLFCIFFRGWLYRQLISYQPEKERPVYAVNDPELIDYLDKDFKRISTAAEIIRYALSKTTEHLNFTAENNELDPNKLIHSKKAHCIGYAAFFESSCNYLFEKQGLSDWSARSYAAELHLFNYNIHRFFKSPFFKDHDFVIVRNSQTGEMIAVDPALSDCFWISWVSVKE